MAARRTVRVTIGALGFSLAALAAPVAAADPVPPVDPAAPTVVDAAPASVTPADGVSHLPSPENLPPGTTQAAPEHPKLGYLRDIWQSIRGNDISASDALLIIAQRPVDENRLADSVPSNQGGPAATAAADAPPLATAPAPAVPPEPVGPAPVASPAPASEPAPAPDPAA